MNKERRKALDALIEDLDKLRGQIDDLRDGIESIKDEEQDYYDNMPESFQNGDKGQLATDAIDNLQTAVDTLEGFDIDEAISAINSAMEG